MAVLVSPSGTFRGRDPWVFHKDGYYYHVFSQLESVAIAKSETMEGLRHAEAVTVYVPEEGKVWSKNLWAPELHILDGKCYIYLGCDDGKNVNHRIYCLGNDSSDPMAPYKLLGQVTDPTDKWAIDGTILELDGKRYMIWSGWEGDENVAQHLYIAEMADPHTFVTPRHRISTPDQDWEKRGSEMRSKRTGEPLPTINEGPVVLKKDRKVYVVYSASGSWCDDYCLGMLTYLGGDPLEASSWQKTGPVFRRNEKVSGPGHCSFTFDGEDHWIVYHAFDEVGHTKWTDAHAVAQKYTWNGDVPEFGTPEWVDPEK